ncbi:transposase [Roseomonas terrae]|uniref:Transposase n=1 Tax=Neoroseomonas terrae TaxID=424799 RepID=A0ABS5ECW0_9PROT|nr:transposase [Neoroseomonas terrae]MBR0648857.1 transposase [Neoroseomonas terrae]
MNPSVLTPLQFHALLPFILPRSPAGRQIGDLRARMNAIFHLACTTDPWRALPPEHGKPDTVSRYFRRLTHAGLWERLLEAIKDHFPNHPLNEIAPSSSAPAAEPSVSEASDSSSLSVASASSPP